MLVYAPFLFTGREYDGETGLYHYRTRAYSAQLGRFLQPDSIDFSGNDVNIYRYAFNNPLNLIDPLGTFSWPSVVGVVGGIVSFALFPAYPAIAIGIGVVAAGLLIYDLYDTFQTREQLEDVIECTTEDHFDTINQLSQPGSENLPLP